MKNLLKLCFIIIFVHACATQSDESVVSTSDSEQAQSGDFMELIAPLGNTCTEATVAQDCKQEIAMALSDECVENPGVFCHPQTSKCSMVVNTTCYFQKHPNKCLAKSDCDDGNDCTFNTCVGSGICMTAHQPDGTFCDYSPEIQAHWVCQKVASGLHPACVPDFVEPECVADLDCEDGNPCTANSCNPATESCEVSDIEGCCLDNAECSDDELCTVDACVNNVCTNEVDENCCEKDHDCIDNIVCNTHSCVQNQCVYDEITDGNCTECESDEDCPEPEGYDAYCSDFASAMIGYKYLCNETNNGKRCSTLVTYELEPCEFGCNDNVDACAPECMTDAECNDGMFCTVDVCVNETCEYTDKNTVTCVKCNSDQDCADFNSQMCIGSELAEGMYVCTEFENEKRCSAMVNTVTLCDFGCDHEANECVEPECITNTDCSDLTFTSCEDDLETTTFYGCVTGFCEVSGDLEATCEFGCTTDNITCASEPAPECVQSSDCNDDDVCTDNACVDGVCEYTQNDACCQSDADCQDGLMGTVNACVDSTCITTVEYPGETCDAVVDCGSQLFDGVDCVDSVCAYHTPNNNLYVEWITPVGWDLDYVHLEGTFCESGAAPGMNGSEPGIITGTCNLGGGWGVLETTQGPSIWGENKALHVETLPNGQQKVSAYITNRPWSAHYFIGQWVYDQSFAPLDYLCNHANGPKSYNGAWKGSSNYGDINYTSWWGAHPQATIHPGDGQIGCLFWVYIWH